MIAVVDYGVGNLASMQNMLKKIGVECLVTSSQKDIENANKIILPGVGAFDTCAAKLQESGLVNTLHQKVLIEKVPVLGVCVGMQLLLESSEEGLQKGLGWIKGRIVRFNKERMAVGTKIPHIGWTDVTLAKPSTVFNLNEQEERFYFVHSYHAQLTDEQDAAMYAEYGYRFVAALEHDNIKGVQFHPEKSHKFGMKLLRNFSAS